MPVDSGTAVVLARTPSTVEELRQAASEFIIADRVAARHGGGDKYRAAMYARWLAAVRRFRTEGRG